MTECNGCGGCCDPVFMPYSQEQALAYKDQIGPESMRWIQEDLTPMSRRQAKLREPKLVRRLSKLRRQADAEPMHFYSCRHFDPDTRRCLIYENRPPVCRRYPWLLGKSVPGTPLPAACSFNADIGQPVELRRKS